MNVLFVHTNFPAQFRFLAQHLASDPTHRVAAIGSQTARPLPGVLFERYRFDDLGRPEVHSFARRFDREARRAEQVLYALGSLEARGFVPDVIVAHSGWGETLPLGAKFPRAHLVAYCEYYYREAGQDLHFDPEFPPVGVDGIVHLRARNAAQLLALAECDRGLSPTPWQRATYPPEFHDKIAVAHEGVDVERVRPDPSATFPLPSGVVLPAGAEVLTFVARNLEPMRGYHVFMRALPEILRARPGAHVVIVGADGVSYGAHPPDRRTWKQTFLAEVAPRLDLTRVHFVGNLPYELYLRLLQVSRVHVYLTYPFVLSWSAVEALAAGCLVVASDTEPVRDVIADGHNGRLVPFFDVAALSAAVVDGLAHPERFMGLRAQARRDVVTHLERERACAAQLAAILPA